jgi:hypothetical protein
MKRYAIGLNLAILAAFAGCDTVGYDPGTLPAGSGDVNVRTPGTPGATTPEDVDVDVQLDGDRSPAVTSNPTVDTPAERRAERRERIGEAIDNVDVNVDSNGADVNID